MSIAFIELISINEMLIQIFICHYSFYYHFFSLFEHNLLTLSLSMKSLISSLFLATSPVVRQKSLYIGSLN